MYDTLGAKWYLFFFFQAEDGIRDADVTGVQTCALPISGTESTCDPKRSGRASASAPGRCPRRLPTGSIRTSSPAPRIRPIAYWRPAMSASLKATQLTPPWGLRPKRDTSATARFTRSPFTRQAVHSGPCGRRDERPPMAAAATTNSRRCTSGLCRQDVPKANCAARLLGPPGGRYHLTVHDSTRRRSRACHPAPLVDRQEGDHGRHRRDPAAVRHRALAR